MTLQSETREDYERLWAHVEPENSRRLLLAALEVFAAKGFHAATTREIAERVGMSSAAIYVHYPSKVELLLQITVIGHKSVLTDAREATELFSDPVDRIRGFVEAFTAWHARYHTLAHVTQYEIAAFGESQFREIRRLRRKIVQFLENEVRGGEEAGLLEIADRAATLTAILSLGIDVARWYGVARSPSPDVLGRLYGDLVLKMLQLA